jgi:hypothetical protein
MRLPATAVFVSTLSCFALTACGAPLGTCGLRTDVGGASTLRFTGEDDAACATQHSFDTGLEVLFIGTNAQGSLELVVDDVTEGEVGSDYPTHVVVTNPASERWQSSRCRASISEHRLVETELSEIGELRHHRVSGDGSCAEPLERTPAGGDSVTLGPFAFRAAFTWRD